MASEPVRPDPRDFQTQLDYEKAMDDYLASIGVDSESTSVEGAMVAFREWRQNPPTDGWE